MIFLSFQLVKCTLLSINLILRNESSKAPLAIRCLGYNPVDSILHGTPLQSTRIWNHINSTQPFRMAHLSDALRLVLVYK